MGVACASPWAGLLLIYLLTVQLGGSPVTFSNSLTLYAGHVLLPFCYAHPLPTFKSKFPHRKADIQFLSFWVWLSAVGQCSPVPVIPLQDTRPRCSLWTDNIAGEFISFSLSILLLSGARHMTAVTSEKINRSVQVSLLCTCFLLSGHKPTQAWESGLGRRSIFNLLKTLHSVSCVATLTHLHLCLQRTKVLSLRILFNICCIVLFR